MLQFYTILFFQIIVSIAYCQVWEDVWPAQASGRNEGVAVAQTSGGVVFGGNFRGQFEYDGTVLSQHGNFQQGFLSKANKDGSLVWMHNIQASNNVFTEAIALYDDIIAFGGVYVDTLFLGPDTLINEGQKGIFVALYDTLGNYIKAINPDVNSASIYDLHFDVSGNLLITGNFFRWFNFGAYSFDSPEGMNIFLTKYDVVEDEVKWMEVSQGNGNFGKSIDTDSFGNIFLVGSYGSNTLFLNQQLPNNNGNHNFFCAKLSTHGELKWLNTITGLGQVHGNAVKCGKGEDVFFSGDFELEIDSLDSKLIAKGFTNAFIGSYNSFSGDLKWIQRVGGDDNDKGVKIEVDSIGNPLTLLEGGMYADVAGTQLPTNGFVEPLLLKLDKDNGGYIWHTRVKSIPGVGNVGANGFSYSNRDMMITGANRNGIYFHGENIPSNNNRDFYLALFKDTSDFNINDPVNHLPNIAKKNFNVYPNPSEGIVYINSSDKFISEIKVFDFKGKLISINFPSSSLSEVHLPSQKGIYFVEIISDSTREIYKVLKL